MFVAFTVPFNETICISLSVVCGEVNVRSQPEVEKLLRHRRRHADVIVGAGEVEVKLGVSLLTPRSA